MIQLHKMRKEDEMAKKADYKWDNIITPTKRGYRPGEPIAAISSRGMITLNRYFLNHAKKQLEGANKVILRYSPTKPRAIIMQFTDVKQDNTLSLAGKGRGNRTISAKGFFNHQDVNIIPSEIEGKYVPKLTKIPKIGNCWIIDLDEKKTSE